MMLSTKCVFSCVCWCCVRANNSIFLMAAGAIGEREGKSRPATEEISGGLRRASVTISLTLVVFLNFQLPTRSRMSGGTTSYDPCCYSNTSCMSEGNAVITLSENSREIRALADPTPCTPDLSCWPRQACLSSFWHLTKAICVIICCHFSRLEVALTHFCRVRYSCLSSEMLMAASDVSPRGETPGRRSGMQM